MGLVATALAQLEAAVEIGDAVEIGRPVPQAIGHEMDHARPVSSVLSTRCTLPATPSRREPMTMRR